jgi:hypothetical protein
VHCKKRHLTGFQFITLFGLDLGSSQPNDKVIPAHPVQFAPRKLIQNIRIDAFGPHGHDFVIQFAFLHLGLLQISLQGSKLCFQTGHIALAPGTIPGMPSEITQKRKAADAHKEIESRVPELDHAPGFAATG